MELCEKMGLDKDNYSVSIPLGSTINMDGAAIIITVMTLAAAHTLGISVSIPTAIVLSILATLSACGAWRTLISYSFNGSGSLCNTKSK